MDEQLLGDVGAQEDGGQYGVEAEKDGGEDQNVDGCMSALIVVNTACRLILSYIQPSFG